MDISIKDIPDEIMAKIDKMAEKERRTRTQQIIIILELAAKANGK